MEIQGVFAMRLRMPSMLLSMALALCATSASAQSISPKAYIAIRGHAEVRVVPDTFPVSVWIHDIEMDRSKAEDTVETIARQTVAAARKMGLGDADMSLGNLRVSSEFERDELGKQAFVGSRYERRFEFRFRRLADLKKFLSALSTTKQVQTQVGSFSLSRERDVRRLLVADAAKDAKFTGDAFAGSVGKKLGDVLAISDKPLGQVGGGFINPIDISDVESTTVLTAEQVARVPASSNQQMFHLLAPTEAKDVQETVLSEGVVSLAVDVYVVYALID